MAVIERGNVIEGAVPPLQVAEGVITSAQILAMQTTPVELVPAPGSGKVNVVETVYLQHDVGTAYGGIASGDDIEIRYRNATGVEVMDIEATGFMDQSTGQHRWGQPSGGADFSLAQNNYAIVAHLGGAITGGSFDLNFRVHYRVVTQI